MQAKMMKNAGFFGSERVGHPGAEFAFRATLYLAVVLMLAWLVWSAVVSPVREILPQLEQQSGQQTQPAPPESWPKPEVPRGPRY